jgi:hypothetical protein
MITSVSLAADPAELELAIVACHVIAPLTLLYMGFATRTQSHVLAFCPLLEFLVNSVLA